VKRAVLLPLAMLAALAACEPFEPAVDETKLRAQNEAQEAFEKWVDDTLKGNAEANYRGTSDRMKSRWLFERLREEDSLARDWRFRLTGSARTDLDLWLAHNEKNPSRVELLPSSVLATPSLADLWKDYFKLQFPAIKEQFTRLEIAQVFSDEQAVSILLRSSLGRDMVELVPAEGTWKVNHYKRAPGILNR